MPKFKFFKQLDMMDCGPTCLRMVARHHGKSLSVQSLRQQSHIDREGVSLFGISHAAEKIGFRTVAVRVPYEELVKEKPTPFIAHWKQVHFVVVYKITAQKVSVADPAHGLLTYTPEEFCKNWATDQDHQRAGFCLLLEPSPDFYADSDFEAETQKSFAYFLRYLTPHRKLFLQLFLGMLASSIFSLLAPFLTQSLVDSGINRQDLDFIFLILVAQLMLFVGSTTINILRSWLLLHITTRINIALVSDFLRKMMRLSIGFFDSKNLGDILQRMRDNQRIQSFLTSSSLNFAFSLFHL